VFNELKKEKGEECKNYKATYEGRRGDLKLEKMYVGI